MPKLRHGTEIQNDTQSEYGRVLRAVFFFDDLYFTTKKQTFEKGLKKEKKTALLYTFVFLSYPFTHLMVTPKIYLGTFWGVPTTRLGSTALWAEICSSGFCVILTLKEPALPYSPGTF